jgi:hypothetical protein
MKEAMLISIILMCLQMVFQNPPALSSRQRITQDQLQREHVRDVVLYCSELFDAEKCLGAIQACGKKCTPLVRDEQNMREVTHLYQAKMAAQFIED